MTIFPLEVVEALHSCEREHFWERVLAPTLNQRVAFGGLDRLTWEFVSTDSVSDVHHKSLHSKAEFLISKDISAGGVSTAIDFLSQVSGHVHTMVFDRLFRKVKSSAMKHWGVSLPRRIVVRVPSYSQLVLDTVNQLIRKEIRKIFLPQGLQN